MRTLGDLDVAVGGSLERVLVAVAARTSSSSSSNRSCDSSSSWREETDTMDDSATLVGSARRVPSLSAICTA